MKHMKERKNGGFSLIELLIAITILGIIVTPFMHSFVTASRTNAKAQKIQNATILASNLMEEVKANSMGDLAFQFNYPERADNSSRFDVVNQFSGAYELVLKDGSLQNVTKFVKNDAADNRDYVTASVIYEDYEANNTDTYEYLGQDLGRYYFVMKGLHSGKSEYDALITMNSNGYKTLDDKGYNDQETPEIESLNVLEDAFFVQSKDQDAECAQSLAEKAGIDIYSTLIDGNLANGELSRKITIDIEQDGALTRAYATYEYSYGGFVETQKFLIYNNAESPSHSLKSVYLFYLPFYSSTGASTLDEIVINNNDNIDTNVYLVKQRQLSANTAALITKETAYVCKVSVLENVTPANYSTHDAFINLRTNLGNNLYKENTPIASQLVLSYGTGLGIPSQYVSNMLDIKALDGSVVRDRIYEVTVSIYEEGEADALFAGDPIATITGSKDN